VLRECTGDVCYLVHKVFANASALIFHGGFGIKADRTSEIRCLKIGRDVHGDKRKFFSRLAVVHLRNVDKSVLKIADDVISVHIVFGEDDDIVAFVKLCYGVFKSADYALVAVYADSMRIIENTDSDRGNYVR